MNYPLPIASGYHRAIFDALVLQAVVALLSGLALDFGQASQICGMALLAFWGGVLVLIWRHRFNPTALDLGLVRVGYLPVILMATLLAPAIWHLRGVW